MKQILSIVIITLFITLSAKGQNLLFIGDQSYPSSETYTLQSFYTSNLNVLFAKDKDTPLFVVSIYSRNGIEVSGQLIIYLNNGSVLRLKQERTDFVDNTSKAVYNMTEDELNLMKSSNINTVRFTLKHEDYDSHPDSGNFTASNNGDSIINFPEIVSEFFD